MVARPARTARHPDTRRVHAMEELARRMRGLVMAGEFDRAFLVGERLMAARPTAEVVESLIYPIDTGLTTDPDSRFYEMLEAIKLRQQPRRLRAWYILLRSVILDRLRWSGEAIRVSGELLELPARYGWMRWHRGLMIMNNVWDFTTAKEDFRAVLESAPQVWKAKALIAEIDIAAGATAAALKAMAELEREVAPRDLPAVRCWRGEMLLWVGRYEEALPDLDWAVANASPLARCWRGGCRVMLGRHEEALADLDEQLRAHPDDREALIWRGEARRLIGRSREALEDLDAICRQDSHDVWARLNRGLAKADLGDRAGAWADYSILPDWVRHYFIWKLSAKITPETPTPELRAHLEKILAAAKGVRRSNQYLFSLWAESPAK